MDAIAWAFAYHVRMGKRLNETSLRRFRSAFERCYVASQRDPKLRARSSVTMWKCIQRCIREGKFGSSSEGKENSDNVVQTEWIDWILFAVSSVRNCEANEVSSKDMLNVLARCSGSSSACQCIVVLAEIMGIERRRKMKKKGRISSITKQMETLSESNSYRVSRMWKSVSHLVSVTEWDEMKDLVKALDLASLAMSSSEEDHTVRCLKFRAHALQICSKRKDFLEKEETVDVLCDLTKFEFKVTGKNDMTRKSLNAIGSIMYNIGAQLYNNSKCKVSIRPFLESCRVCTYECIRALLE